MEDLYQWEAQYNDGTTLKQRDNWDDRDTAHAFKDIDLSQLAYFSLKDRTGNVKVAVILDGEGDRLVWTRRGSISTSGLQTLTHIVGKKGEFIMALFEDGSVATRHNFVNDGLFDEIGTA